MTQFLDVRHSKGGGIQPETSDPLEGLTGGQLKRKYWQYLLPLPKPIKFELGKRAGQKPLGQ